MVHALSDLAFWQALGAIIWVNLLLSGDNAVVIALAARSLSPRQQRLAVLGGSGAAIVMRVVLTAFAVALLGLPWVKLVGSGLLLWIGVKLLVPEETESEVPSGSGVFSAIRTILVADLVMSLDNVIAVAAAAEQGPDGAKLALLVIGLGLSIPIVIFGSGLMLRVMERFPIVITLGGALLGWIAGETSITDPVLAGRAGEVPWLHEYRVPAVAGAIVVVALGKWLAARQHDLAAQHRSRHQAGRPNS